MTDDVAPEAALEVPQTDTPIETDGAPAADSAPVDVEVSDAEATEAAVAAVEALGIDMPEATDEDAIPPEAKGDEAPEPQEEAPAPAATAMPDPRLTQLAAQWGLSAEVATQLGPLGLLEVVGQMQAQGQTPAPVQEAQPDPNVLAPLALNLDPDLYDESVVTGLQQIVDYNNQVGAMMQAATQRLAALEQASNAQAAQRFHTEFVDGLKKLDPMLQPLVGDGEPTPAQEANRHKILEEMGTLMQVRQLRGLQPLPVADMIRKASAIAFDGDYQKAARQAVARQVQKRSGQLMHMPSRSRGIASEIGDDAAVAAVAKVMEGT